MSVEPQVGRDSSHERWRVFCAVHLPDYSRERVIRHAEGLRKAVPHAQASWTRKENIHLTLKFLGELPVSHVDNLSMAAARAVKGVSAFEIYLGETGTFPKHGPPRVLWIGIRDHSGKLAALSSRLEDECVNQGLAKEERPFQPHLTLARLRKQEGARTLAAAHKAMHFEPLEVVVSELLVIRSELSSAGSKYSMISRHSLSKCVRDSI